MREETGAGGDQGGKGGPLPPPFSARETPPAGTVIAAVQLTPTHTQGLPVPQTRALHRGCTLCSPHAPPRPRPRLRKPPTPLLSALLCHPPALAPPPHLRVSLVRLKLCRKLTRRARRRRASPMAKAEGGRAPGWGARLISEQVGGGRGGRIVRSVRAGAPGQRVVMEAAARPPSPRLPPLSFPFPSDPPAFTHRR